MTKVIQLKSVSKKVLKSIPKWTTRKFLRPLVHLVCAGQYLNSEIKDFFSLEIGCWAKDETLPTNAIVMATSNLNPGFSILDLQLPLTLGSVIRTEA